MQPARNDGETYQVTDMPG